MGKKLSAEQMALYKAIDQILFNTWDPIGISTEGDWPQDEYRQYLPRVFVMALGYQAPEEIAEYLTEISTQQMGLDARPEHDLNIAKLVLAATAQCLR